MKLFLGSLLCSLIGITNVVNAATIRTPIARQIDFSASLLANNRYDMEIEQSFKINRGFSIIALSSPIELTLQCGDKTLAVSSLFYDDTMDGEIFTLKLAAKNVFFYCPKRVLNLTLSPNGVELDADLQKAAFVTFDRGEDVKGFLSRYEQDKKSKVEEMIFFHGQMSASIKNQSSFHCLIKGYEGDILKEDIVKDLTEQYKTLFGTDYATATIDCSKQVSIQTEIASCQVKPLTAFCSNYRLYSESIAWLKAARDQATAFKSEIAAETALLQNELQTVIDQINGDLQTSVAQTGAL